MQYFLGLDIGSVALKAVVINRSGSVLHTYYKRVAGQPLALLRSVLDEILGMYDASDFAGVCSTGSGGRLAQDRIGGDFLNEVLSSLAANHRLLPNICTIIEMGGEDSKLISVQQDESSGKLLLDDLAMNSLCAAGTGSFLDQQASRLGLSIEGEFGELAVKSEHPPRIAGRCSVFAKSDMIHLQQTATPDYDIVAGLCYAVARNFKSAIATGKKFVKPISFQGGVAANVGMIKAFEDILDLKPGELIVPEMHKHMPALGAALYAATVENPALFDLRSGFSLITDMGKTGGAEPLTYIFPDSKCYDITSSASVLSADTTEGCLGIDIGSLSTNVVVIDKDNNVLARRYLMTAGRPLEAVRKGLKEVGDELAGRVRIAACGTTGSGRYLVGDFVGADIVRNEITAQATAAIAIDPKVDTIFEIGGQDSKFVSIDNGVVIDFEMNKACAAGTGSFLQEQAEKLDIRIETEFGERALNASCPVGCGERCTVFMESDLVAHQQSGADKDDLIAGLAYSIVNNYLTKVVQERRIGKHIFFQGGVAWNKAVVAAFENVTGQSVTVPPHHDVTGAIGAAMLAREEITTPESRFKGFDLTNKTYRLESFVCEDCSNMCEIRRVVMEGEEPLYYGSRCEKYDVDQSSREAEGPDLYKLREKYLYAAFKRPVVEGRRSVTIGLPRVLIFHELYPFWSGFFRSLGYKTILSAPTNQRILDDGLQHFSSETCFPIKVTFGHIMDLVKKEVDYIFLPSIISVHDEGSPHIQSYLCPYIQAIPYNVRANVDLSHTNVKLVSFAVSLRMDMSYLLENLRELMQMFGLTYTEYEAAVQAAFKSQTGFYGKCRDAGDEFLDSLDPDEKAVCVISRPYNGCDNKLSLEIPKKIRGLGVKVVPMDFLPLEKYLPNINNSNMYWRFGQKILAAADFIRQHPNLYAVYITNFGCGPDSFITHFFAKQMEGKPFLQVEIDEHSADAGIITRLEAFLDSLKAYRAKPIREKVVPPSNGNGYDRKVYIPYMSDHAVALAAAMEACGTEAEPLPQPTSESLNWGKKFTSGKECFPCQVTMGDMIRKIKEPGFDQDRAAFFMPSAGGPCRFGQYHLLQRSVLDKLGYNEVPIYSPDSENSYNDFPFLEKRFRRVAWAGVVATDLLFKLYRKYRPYVTNNPECDKLYKDYLNRLAGAIRRDENLQQVLFSALSDFKRLSHNGTERKPVIAVVGEIFLRLNSFSNNSLIERLEELGAEVWLAPMSEWIFYTNFTYKLQSRKDRDFKSFVGGYLKDKIQKNDEKRLADVLLPHVPIAHEASVEDVIKLAQPFIDVSLSGEAILSVGKAIDYFNRGASGVINTLPFNCMPGTIVTSISKKVQSHCGGLPWLNLAYEGLEDKNEEIRLEAFLLQVRQFDENRRSGVSSHQ
ncbi:MAG: CoA activase [candidate division Zixibacteria bacterium]|nr:CoA activase [candidate division Zixibacteria bacterium]MBU1469299.1 CoA activase [candidate division Zixibacteria bacterium]MBU2624697.1 CoA activase [candidate division Zixibacteria bacterium]